ncbi:hypothetical protein M3C63_08730 [Brevibacterium luteolum]|uniref:hypothetical protein n=1 Tax=Brevibacterium luteolum TaxID=199591 RepID=UPI00223BEBF5|nr:hypothetical protein [Brevibacterium luteolum]MCT1921940.1 hypothetical protein [Brevibacterium luteolum]
MSTWIPILARIDYAAEVMQLITELERDLPDISEVTISAATTSTVPTDAPAESVSDDADNADDLTWSREDLERLAAGIFTTTQRWTRAMDVCVEQPGKHFATSQVAEMTGMSVDEWRDACRKISRHLKRHYPSVPRNAEGEHAWPLRAKALDGELGWAMTPATARLWKSIRG